MSDIEFLRRVLARLKHGPNEVGDAGPCRPDCLKCEADRRLVEIVAAELTDTGPETVAGEVRWRELVWRQAFNAALTGTVESATVDPTSKANRAGAIADAAVVRWQQAWQVKP